MTLLAGTLYDPGGAFSQSVTTAAAAMTNVNSIPELGFVAPANGSVLVRMRCTVHGATTFPQILLGLRVQVGGAVVARVAPLGALKTTAVATAQLTQEALFVVPGLVAGDAYLWRACYGVETLVASTAIKYGGPDNATTNDAMGGFVFEIYDTPGLLGAKLYDPASAVSKSCASRIAMTALDTSNLRITFTAPPSGNVLVRLRTNLSGATTMPTILLGVLDGATVKGRQSPLGGLLGTALATTNVPHDATFVVTGLTAGTSYTWDAAYGVEILLASTNIHYGGPDNGTANDAWGAFQYEIWDADAGLPFLGMTGLGRSPRDPHVIVY